MFKFVIVLSALIAIAAAKPGLLAAAPLAYTAPAGVVTATSSQVIARNHNGIAAATYVAAPAARLAVAAPVAAAAPLAYSAPVAAAAPLAYSAPVAAAAPFAYSAPVAAAAPLAYSAPVAAAAPLAYSAPLSYASAPVLV